MALLEQRNAPIATYPYSDIDEGQGNIILYPYGSVDTSSTTYHLIKTSIYSGLVVLYKKNAAVGTTTYTFDTDGFQQPKVVDGTILLTFSFAINPGSAGTYTTGFTVAAYHYDDSSETQLGSTWISATFNVAGGVAKVTKNYVARITAARTKFKRGEKIRLKIGIVVSGSTTTTSERELGIDPKNRDGIYLKPSTDATITSVAELIVPFELPI